MKVCIFWKCIQCTIHWDKMQMLKKICFGENKRPSFLNDGVPTSVSLFLSIRSSVRLFVCLSVCCAPLLRNCALSNHNFWYTCVKWWYLQVFFFLIFFKFGIFGLSGILSSPPGIRGGRMIFVSSARQEGNCQTSRARVGTHSGGRWF